MKITGLKAHHQESSSSRPGFAPVANPRRATGGSAGNETQPTSFALFKKANQVAVDKTS